jgi:hypothetical protein
MSEVNREELDRQMAINKSEHENKDWEAIIKYCKTIQKYYEGDILFDRNGDIGRVDSVGYTRGFMTLNPEPFYSCFKLTKKMELRQDGAMVRIYQSAVERSETI